jgi:hypothetical protein
VTISAVSGRRCHETHGSPPPVPSAVDEALDVAVARVSELEREAGPAAKLKLIVSRT